MIRLTIVFLLWISAATTTNAQELSDEERFANEFFATIADRKIAPNDKLRVFATTLVLSAASRSGENFAELKPDINSAINELVDKWSNLGDPFLDPGSFTNRVTRALLTITESVQVGEVQLGKLISNELRLIINPPGPDVYGSKQAISASYRGSSEFLLAQLNSTSNLRQLRALATENQQFESLIDQQFRNFQQPIEFKILDTVNEVIDKGENADVAVLIRNIGSSISEVSELAKVILSDQTTITEKLEAQTSLLSISNMLIEKILGTANEIKQDVKLLQADVTKILKQNNQILIGQASIVREILGVEARLEQNYLKPILGGVGALLEIEQKRLEAEAAKARRETIYAGANAGVFLLEFVIGLRDADLARKVGAVGSAAIQITRAFDQHSSLALTNNGALASDFLVSGASSLQLSASIINATVTIINAFANKPTPEEIISQQILAIGDQIEELSKLTVAGFQRLDSRIERVFDRSNQILTLVDFRTQQIVDQADTLLRELQDLTASVGALRVTLDVYFQEGLRSRVRNCQGEFLGFSDRNNGLPLPFPLAWNEAEACFWTHGVTQARGALSGIGVNRWTADEVINNLREFEVSGRNAQLTYLSRLLDRRYGINETPFSIPSIHDWKLAAESYMTLADENPEASALIPASRWTAIINTGTQIQNGLSQLERPSASGQSPVLTIFDSFADSLRNFKAALAREENDIIRSTSLSNYLSAPPGQSGAGYVFEDPGVNLVPANIENLRTLFLYDDACLGATDAPDPDPARDISDYFLLESASDVWRAIALHQQLSIGELLSNRKAPLRPDGPPATIVVCVEARWRNIELTGGGPQTVFYRGIPSVSYFFYFGSVADRNLFGRSVWTGEKSGWWFCLRDRPEQVGLVERPFDTTDCGDPLHPFMEAVGWRPEAHVFSVVSGRTEYVLSQVGLETEVFRARLRTALFQEMLDRLDRTRVVEAANELEADLLALRAVVETIYPGSFSKSGSLAELLEGDGFLMVRPSFVRDLYSKAAEVGYRYNVRDYVQAEVELPALERLLLSLVSEVSGEYRLHTDSLIEGLRAASERRRLFVVSPRGVFDKDFGISLSPNGPESSFGEIGVVSPAALTSAAFSFDESVVGSYQLVGADVSEFTLCLFPGLTTRYPAEVRVRLDDKSGGEWPIVDAQWSLSSGLPGGRPSLKACINAAAGDRLAITVTDLPNVGVRLRDPDGVQIAEFVGRDPGDYSGRAIAALGDVNGDGINDVMIGAPRARTGSDRLGSGEAYVVFGKSNANGSTGLPALFDLNRFDGTNGFIISAGDETSDLGFSISGAGDINGDGISDLLVGTLRGNKAYAVFGRSGDFPAEVVVTELDVSAGVTFISSDEDLSDGLTVSEAGDINGDGRDDIVLSDAFIRCCNDDRRTPPARAHIVFGHDSGVGAKQLSGEFDLTALDGTNGFIVNGVDHDLSFAVRGFAISSAGDFDGDGVDDLALGDVGSGEIYVLFGNSSNDEGNLVFPARLALHDLDGNAGLVAAIGDGVERQIGATVKSVGDVNVDGYDDLIIGSISNEAFILFGGVRRDRASSMRWPVELGAIEAGEGIRIRGTGDYTSVAGAGDVNGDGVVDFLVGSYLSSPFGQTRAGETYVIFGKDPARGDQPFDPIFNTLTIDGKNGFFVSGTETENRSGSALAAVDINNDGLSDIFVGAFLGDPFGRVSAGKTFLVYGR